MLRLRTIVHPTDFSRPAGYAFELARRRGPGAELVVVHAARTLAPRREDGHREAVSFAPFPNDKVRPGRSDARVLLAGDPVPEILWVTRGDAVRPRRHGHARSDGAEAAMEG